MKTHLLTVSLPLSGYQHCSKKKGFNPSEKHTHTATTPHIKWQWNKVQLLMLKGLRGRRFKASGDTFLKWWVKECKLPPPSKKMELAKELKKTNWLSWVSQTLTIHFIYSHCLPTLISLIQEQTIAMLHNGKSLGHFLQKQNGFYPYVPKSL